MAKINLFENRSRRKKDRSQQSFFHLQLRIHIKRLDFWVKLKNIESTRCNPRYTFFARLWAERPKVYVSLSHVIQSINCILSLSRNIGVFSMLRIQIFYLILGVQNSEQFLEYQKIASRKPHSSRKQMVLFVVEIPINLMKG